jgi:hypothetical protein
MGDAVAAWALKALSMRCSARAATFFMEDVSPLEIAVNYDIRS